MKVGILTFPNSNSYGAVLQMLATYHTVAGLGCDPEIINYHNAWMRNEKHYVAKGRSGWRKETKRKAARLLHWKLHSSFRRFERRMARFPARPTSDKTELPRIGKRYDAVICGSDQVWNPDITGSDLSFFLDFCGPDTARISYAPSFGVESLPEDFGRAVKGELAQFAHLSVREESGNAILRQLGLEARLVVDPTLLLEAKEWEAWEEPHPMAQGEYILYYTVKSSESLWKYCCALARKTNKKILRIGGNMLTAGRRSTDQVKYLCDVTPGQWLYLVHHAACVVTNSFHGTAFSVNYRKPFYVELSSLTNSRLHQIVTMLDLEAQIVNAQRQPEEIAIDYSRTEQVLPGMRSGSMEFLREALNRK